MKCTSNRDMPSKRVHPRSCMPHTLFGPFSLATQINVYQVSTEINGSFVWQTREKDGTRFVNALRDQLHLKTSSAIAGPALA
eukprot:3781957-Pleurochrysis_carterae.AAC.3